MKQFKIPFKGLSLGMHEFDWALDKKFFEAFENPDVLDCKLAVGMNMERQERMMILDFNFHGHLEVACDRCLEPFEFPVTVEEQFIIKLGESYKEESESVLIIPENEYQIDVSELIFDFVSLSMPIRKVHPEDVKGNSTCNKEALSRLEELGKKNAVDPRWEALKNIKLDNNQ